MISNYSVIKSSLHISSTAVIHVFVYIILLIVLIIQSCLLNYYIIFPNKNSVKAYLWFGADLFVLILFTTALVVAHKYLTSARTSQCKIVSACRRRNTKPFTWLGALPLSYLSWLIYACILISKLIVVFTSSSVHTISPNAMIWGPQLLKLAISLSAPIFALLVEGHHDAKVGSRRNAYIRLLCGCVAFEIMDSVEFLGLLFVSETHWLYSFRFERIILALAAVSFLLPTLTIYTLSVCDFGLSSQQQQTTQTSVCVYRLLHLLCVNVAFVCVRLYLWCTQNTDISVFLMKNLLGVCTTLYTLWPDMHGACVWLRGRRGSRHLCVEGGGGVSEDVSHTEMQPLGDTGGHKT